MNCSIYLVSRKESNWTIGQKENYKFNNKQRQLAKRRQGDKLRGLLVSKKKPLSGVEAPPNSMAPVRVSTLLFTSSKFICK